MVELVDTPDLGSGAARCVGSSPILGTSPETFSETEVFPVFSFSKFLVFCRIIASAGLSPSVRYFPF